MKNICFQIKSIEIIALTNIAEGSSDDDGDDN